jgi:hypothetical protein
VGYESISVKNPSYDPLSLLVGLRWFFIPNTHPPSSALSVVIVFSSVTLSLAAASLASPSAPSPSSPDPDVDANVRPRAAYSRTNIPVALARAPLARSRRARAGFAVELAVEPPAIVATSRAAASACAHEDDSARAGRSMSGVTIARARRAHRVATDDDDIVARAPE